MFFICSLLFFFVLLEWGSSCKKKETITDSSASDSGLVAHPDHIIFVWFENKGFDRIINSSEAPYINSLRNRGTLFENTFALTHPSYPNYIRFFSGTSNNISTNNCIDGTP